MCVANPVSDPNMELRLNARSFAVSLAKRMLDTRDLSALLRTRRVALERRLYRKPISIGDLRSALRHVGVARGRVVWVQSSWNEFYNYNGKPSDVLAMLQELVGPDGTLVMPTYPIAPDPAKVLDIDRAPSSTGLLTEVFRRTKGIRRSIHLTSSVSALGPAAEFLVADHHTDKMTWGAKSPFWRLTEVDALCVGLGNGRAIERMTPLHAVECMLYDELPYFRKILSGTISYTWRRRTGETGTHEFFIRNGRIKTNGFRRHFDASLYTEARVSNLDVYAARAKPVLERAIALARGGTTIYVSPRAERSLFVPAAA